MKKPHFICETVASFLSELLHMGAKDDYHVYRVMRNNNKKFRSFKSKENIHKKENLLFTYAKTKAQISCTVIVRLIRDFGFAIKIVPSVFFLILKVKASDRLLWLNSQIFIGPVWKPRIQIFS